jgi:hypothetical protein
LPVSENSLAYYCKNCSRSYLVDEDNYKYIVTQNAIFEQSKYHFPYWQFPFSTGKGLRTVGEFARILTGEIPLIAKNKASNLFYLYIPAFKLPDLEILTSKSIRICRTQPLLEISNDEITPAAEMILPESEARQLAKYYWILMRSKYKFLLDKIYDFRDENIGAGEIIWLSMMPFSSNDKSMERERFKSRA